MKNRQLDEFICLFKEDWMERFNEDPFEDNNNFINDKGTIDQKEFKNTIDGLLPKIDTKINQCDGSTEVYELHELKAVLEDVRRQLK